MPSQQLEYFDANWYRGAYPDVSLSGLSPEEHFQKYGRMLKRSPNPGYDTRFCINTYADIARHPDPSTLAEKYGAENPNRPTNAADLASLVQNEKKRARSWYNYGSAVTRIPPILSYCIPIKNRLDDIQGTLAENLKENAAHADKIEFLIVDFGEDSSVLDWVRGQFPMELASGYLQIVQDHHTLDTWHFGKAKNAFRKYMRGEVYSSLDGDNFVTHEETEQLLKVAREHPNGFVFHHFSGSWGDGTSGRVSMPEWIYRNVGYNSQFMPRQFDEMDIILGSLKSYPHIPFVGVDAERNALNLSKFCERFRENELQANRTDFIGDCRHIRPLNPRGDGYTDHVEYWRDMNNLNACISAFNYSENAVRREAYLNESTKYKLNLVENLPKDIIVPTLFLNKDSVGQIDIKPDDICLCACVKDEGHFLKKFVDHYRSLGVTHFFLVDDHSEIPVRDLDLGENVVVKRPKVGNFKFTKTLWMEGLIRAFVPNGTWVLTVDADEFLQIPKPYTTLAEVIAHLEATSQDFATGLLLDMAPNPELVAADIVEVEEKFDAIFDHYCMNHSLPSDEYTHHKSIKWAFGEYADIAWRSDLRYHAFGTLDCMRKFPLFKLDANRHLHQGFHSFLYLDNTPQPSPDVWSTTPILPIFHYKLIKLYSEVERQKQLSLAEGYFSRTRDNIAKIFRSHGGADVAAVSTHLVPKKHALRENAFTSQGEVI